MEVRAHHPEDDEEVDAICVHLEAPGESLLAFVPYERTDEGRIRYGDVFFGPAEPAAFRGNGTAS